MKTLQAKLNPMLPTIKVHCWGGLGSQLYGLALAHHLKSECIGRRVTLILHTSGVTKRKSELTSLSKSIKVRELDDFQESNFQSSTIGGTKRFKQYFKGILLKTRIILDDNVMKSSSSIKPWTISIRGHYTDFSFPNFTLRDISQIVMSQLNSLSASNKFDILVHYRLGDLITLDSKNPLSAKSFGFLSLLPGQIFLVSDSLDVGVHELKNVLNREVLPVPSKGGFDVLGHALNSTCFVGSSSKVSDWAILFRLMLFPELDNYAPASRKSTLARLCATQDSRSLQFFD